MVRTATSNRPSIVCPVDLSEPSRTALNYAAAIADHFAARLLVVSVDDPLLAAAAKEAGLGALSDETAGELKRFVDAAIPPPTPGRTASVEFVVRVGTPATEILRLARESAAELIVMSSHGRRGINKKVLGATTERVLHETTTPVLVTPMNAPRVETMTDIIRHVQRIVAPVDFSDSTPHQVKVAAGIASGLGVPLLVAHVLESIYLPLRVKLAMPGLDRDRRAAAEDELRGQLKRSGSPSSVETLVLAGDASWEIVGVTEARRAGLIVIGLHSSGQLGHRMGSVTYRVLCLTHALVLALPPRTAPAGEKSAGVLMAPRGGRPVRLSA
jgi:nucleotide-binding universal stress UspA family protein